MSHDSTERKWTPYYLLVQLKTEVVTLLTLNESNRHFVSMETTRGRRHIVYVKVTVEAILFY